MTLVLSRRLAAASLSTALSLSAVQAGVNRWSRGTPGTAAIGAHDLHAARGTGTLLAAGGTQRLSRSEDGGRSWSPATDGLFTSPVISIHEDASGNRLFAASEAVLCESVDDGKSWAACSPFAETPLPIFQVVVDPSDPQVLYANSGGSCGRFCIYGSILASTDSGAHWQSLDELAGGVFSRLTLSPDGETVFAIDSYRIWKGGLTSGLQPIQPPFGPISDLAIDPTNPLILYAFLSLEVTQNRGYISQSPDGGLTWARLSDGPATTAPESAVLIDPATPTRIFLATYGAGVFESSDGGVTWSPLNAGLTELAIESLALSPDGQTLYAGTEDAVYQFTFCDTCPPIGRPRPPTRIVHREATAP